MSKKKASQTKKGAADGKRPSKRGGGGAPTGETSQPKNFSETPSDASPTENKPLVGRITRRGKTFATLTAENAADYERAKELIENGIRLEAECREWGIAPAECWKTATFPADSEDWETLIGKLVASKLDDQGTFSSLMFGIERTIRQLWEHLHPLAMSAENPNFKRDAGKLLGELYREAQFGEDRDKELRNGNEDFQLAVTQPGKPADAWLERWTSSKLSLEREYREHAAGGAHRFAEIETTGGGLLLNLR